MGKEEEKRFINNMFQAAPVGVALSRSIELRAVLAGLNESAEY
jgi:hypothetical protein